MLAEKPEGKIPLGRPRHRWVDNIKIDLREIGWYGLVLVNRALKAEQVSAFTPARNFILINSKSSVGYTAFETYCAVFSVK
jgi:hypothetical protein